MLVSIEWLRRHVEITEEDLETLALRFTLGVAELEGVHRIGAVEVTAGRVESAEPIEGTHLHACRVRMGGGDVRPIVCGAPDVRARQLVAVQDLGTKTIRGHESHGMIASERDLGLTDSHEGIGWFEAARPGAMPGEVVRFDGDVVLEIDNKSLTHRPDLWGHRGIAREVAALLGKRLRPLDLDVAFTDSRPLDVRVEDPKACPRYSAVCVDGVTIGPSPLWLRTLLHRVGTRAIDRVVDLTNFVMLDLGNPLHAFDRREIGGDAIVVRRARAGESFTTLDGAVHALNPRDLLVADRVRGVALAGIMGGQNSEIRPDTTSIVLEAANFDAGTIRRTASRLGLRTESSARFEKSLDPRLVADASRSFVKHLLALCPTAHVSSAFLDVAAPEKPRPVLTLRASRVSEKLGVEVTAGKVAGVLRGLEFDVEETAPGELMVGVPSFRATKDVGIEADLVEEIGRSIGYDHIPPAPPRVVLTKPHPNAWKRFERAAKTWLAQGAGLDEVMTYGFAFEPLLERLGAVPEDRLRLRNPISTEMPALRRHLGPNLLGVLEKNARRFERVDVFEWGRVFETARDADGLPVQPVTAGVLVAETGGAGLFARAKGIVEGLLAAVERPAPSFLAGGVEHVWAHPARQARIEAGGAPIGYAAEVHPLALSRLDASHPAAILEIDVEALFRLPVSGSPYVPLRTLPEVYRDFAIVVPRTRAAGEVEAALRSASERIAGARFQSVFELPPDEKCVAFAVTMYRDDRTMTDAEIREVEERVWAAVRAIGGRPRA